MNAVVVLRMVPDVVEELVVAGDGTSLDADAVRLKLSESDEHALEEAILLKEKFGGAVTVLAPDVPDVDDVLFTAAAKGADRLIKLSGEWAGIKMRAIAEVLSSYLRSQSGLLAGDTLILTGSQAIDDAEGEVAACISEHLAMPYIAVVTAIGLENGGAKATVIKEFAGGLRGEFVIPLPAVIGVQSASKPPRYVPVAKIRASMKSAKIESVSVATPGAGLLPIQKMYVPATGGKAEMLSGTPEEVSTKIVDTLVQRGVL